LAGGFTLVEALAGMTILGTLLAGIIVADARLIRHSGQAGRQVEACEIADGLLETWWAKKETFPRNAAGEVQGHKGWRWRTRPVNKKVAEALAAEIIAVEVFAPDQRDDGAAVRVEILLPRKEHETPKRTDTD
jgi:hypothetical protein